MAKKSKTSEDEYLEDYDEDFEEYTPKKKKGGKKKKSNVGKIVAWIVAFIVVLAILLFIRYKYAVPVDGSEGTDELPPPIEYEERTVTAPEEGYEEAGIYEPPKEIGEQVIEREELPKVKEVVDVTAEPELFSNLECNYDYDAGVNYISLRVYNVLEEDFRISPRGVQKGYNTYFLVRGMVDADPGCGTELLLPGEWTECSRIGLDQHINSNVPGTNRISVQVPGKTEALIVECPEEPVVEEE
jgi:hypothetical protein